MALVLQGRPTLLSLSALLLTASGQGGGLARWTAGGPPSLSAVDIWVWILPCCGAILLPPRTRGKKVAAPNCDL